MAVFKHRIDVSPEMLSFIGAGPLPPSSWPEEPAVFSFGGLAESGMPSVKFDPSPAIAVDDRDAHLVFVVSRAAIARIVGSVPDGGVWHLPSAMREMAVAIRDCAAPAAMGDTLRLAKSIELLCAVLEHLGRGVLIQADGDGALCESDARRIAAARRLIDERWHEKLTLDAIARACGLNRGKLTRGFRSMYDCTVADALTEQRLAGARRMLQATDLPVSAIGYRCGYLNNASFTRAFARHVGVAPTRWRAARGVAA